LRFTHAAHRTHARLHAFRSRTLPNTDHGRSNAPPPPARDLSLLFFWTFRLGFRLLPHRVVPLPVQRILPAAFGFCWHAPSTTHAFAGLVASRAPASRAVRCRGLHTVHFFRFPLDVLNITPSRTSASPARFGCALISWTLRRHALVWFIAPVWITFAGCCSPLGPHCVCAAPRFPHPSTVNPYRSGCAFSPFAQQRFADSTPPRFGSAISSRCQRAHLLHSTHRDTLPHPHFSWTLALLAASRVICGFDLLHGGLGDFSAAFALLLHHWICFTGALWFVALMILVASCIRTFVCWVWNTHAAFAFCVAACLSVLRITAISLLLRFPHLCVRALPTFVYRRSPGLGLVSRGCAQYLPLRVGSGHHLAPRLQSRLPCPDLSVSCGAFCRTRFTAHTSRYRRSAHVYGVERTHSFPTTPPVPRLHSLHTTRAFVCHYSSRFRMALSRTLSSRLDIPHVCAQTLRTTRMGLYIPRCTFDLLRIHAFIWFRLRFVLEPHAAPNVVFTFIISFAGLVRTFAVTGHSRGGLPFRAVLYFTFFGAHAHQRGASFTTPPNVCHRAPAFSSRALHHQFVRCGHAAPDVCCF